MLKNSIYELPNIRFGIEQKEKRKVAHILAVQSAQRIHDKQTEENIFNYVKESIPKSKHFRQFNPMHLVSIILSLGIFNGLGIKNE